MKSRETGLEVALNASALRLLAKRAPLVIMVTKREQTICCILTSLHLVFGTLSIWSMGSMKSWFVTTTSGIQMAQRRCAHFPAPVCLKAPPSFGHNTQLYGKDQIGQRIKACSPLTTGVSGETVHFRQSHCPSGM